VGGLVGHNYSMAEIFDEGPAGTVIQDSRYESGDYGGVYGILGVGGLVGWMEEGTISNSLVTGSVGASTNSVGGLVGIVTFLDNTPQVNHSFFNQDANPNLPDSFGEARTDAELRTLSTFAPAWSISYIGDPAQTTWKIASPDGTYLPRLAWEQPINPSSWPRASLSGLYTAMIAYFAETNGFSLDLNYVGWWPPNVSPYFDTVIIGYGTWPPAGFDLSADRTLELWKSQAGELPGALTYHLQAGPPILEHMSSVPYTGTPAGGSWEAGFWAIVIGNVDGDEGADIWLVTNLDRFPAHVDADM
jgi:hypothetical protein